MFIVVLAYFFDQMDGTVLGYVAPSVMKTFGITIQDFAPAQSLYFIGMMLGGIVAGFISDKIGRRKAFLCGCSVFTLATILTGFTNNIHTFTFFRVLTGFGVLGTGAICTTYLSEVLSACDRSKWYGICTGLGLFAVPVIGVVSPWVIPMSDEAWRYLFWQGALGFLPLTLGFLFMKESPRWLIAQGRQADAEAYCGECIDLTEVAEKARLEKDTRPSFCETFRMIFVEPKYRYRSLILFFIASGQNIPSFVSLAEKGKKVTILEMGHFFAPKSEIAERMSLEEHMNKNGIDVPVDTTCTEITPEGVHAVDKDGSKVTFKADTVIISAGSRPLEKLRDSFQGTAFDVINAGDCMDPANIRNATDTGWCAGNII